MDKFMPIGKQSKKKQKEWGAKQRKTWGDFKPVTRTVPNGKAYNRKKLKEDDRRSSSDFRNTGKAAASCEFDFRMLKLCTSLRQQPTRHR